MNDAVKEMTFEEEAILYEKAARELFAKETPGEEAPPINHLIRRGMRIIRKARKEIKRRHGRWELVTTKYYPGQAVRVGYCQKCNEERPVDNFCPNCGADMRVGEKEKLESHSKEDGDGSGPA